MFYNPAQAAQFGQQSRSSLFNQVWLLPGCTDRHMSQKVSDLVMPPAITRSELQAKLLLSSLPV